MEKGYAEVQRKRLGRFLKPSRFSFDYKELKPDIEAVVKTQSKVESMFNDSFFRRWERLLFKGYARNKTLSYLNDQQQNLSSFGKKLLKVMRSTERELGKVGQRRMSLASDLRSNAELAESEKVSLSSNSERFSELGVDFSSASRRDEGYFTMMSDIDDLERTIEEGLHKFKIANDNIVSVRTELDILNVYDAVLKITYQSSERIRNKVNSVEDQLRQICLIYESLEIDSFKRMKKLASQISVNVEGIQEIYVQSLDAIKDVISEPGQSAIMSEDQSDVEEAFEEMKEAALRKSEDIETVVSITLGD